MLPHFLDGYGRQGGKGTFRVAELQRRFPLMPLGMRYSHERVSAFHCDNIHYGGRTTFPEKGRFASKVAWYKWRSRCLFVAYT
jgi:hypothetical protein